MLMLANGATARAVADRFGLTRNAAIGRIHRDSDLREMRSKNHSPKRSQKRVQQQVKEVPEEEPVETTPKPLLELESNECHWSVSFDHASHLHLFCARKTRGDIYCAEHRQRAGTPYQRRDGSG